MERLERRQKYIAQQAEREEARRRYLEEKKRQDIERK